MSISKYNEFYEFNKDQSLSIIDRHNVASISDNGTGIKNLILWIGCKSNEQPVVKVSNNPEDLSGNNLFSIDVENFNIVGTPDKSFINEETLNRIKQFIIKNKTLIIKYTNEEIFTDELVDKLVPYN
jgi:hypothetical protein